MRRTARAHRSKGRVQGRKSHLNLMRRGMDIFLTGVRQASGSASPPAHPDTRGVALRVARAWHDDLLSGYRQDPERILMPLAGRLTEDLVAARDIEFTSVCMHHLLPFAGKVHIAYAPAGLITGLSRLGRLVDCLSRRLQLQEALTRQIADALQQHLAPEGAACIIEASHTCMTSRSARKARSRIVTAAFTGVFRREAARRREVISILGVAGDGAARRRRRS